MNYNEYKNDGWGLSELALKQITKIINVEIDKPKIRVVEFGSGTSSRFLSDLDKVSDKTIIVTSFDNDLTYAYKPIENDNVTLIIRPLVECDDITYNKMFTNKKYDNNGVYLKTSPLTTRQKNNFYNIKKGDLNGVYDLMLLDGPNGNGRNISYLHMKEHLKSGSIVLIDDFHHYDFVEKFKIMFNSELLFKHNDRNSGGEFVIYKII